MNTPAATTTAAPLDRQDIANKLQDVYHYVRELAGFDGAFEGEASTIAAKREMARGAVRYADAVGCSLGKLSLSSGLSIRTWAKQAKRIVEEFGGAMGINAWTGCVIDERKSESLSAIMADVNAEPCAVKTNADRATVIFPSGACCRSHPSERHLALNARMHLLRGDGDIAPQDRAQLIGRLSAWLVRHAA